MKHIDDFTDYILENLEKEEADKIKKHLSLCESCSRKYKDEKKIYNFLNLNYQKLKNSLCPSDDFMEDYLLNHLDKTSEKLFLAHLEDCSPCRDYLEVLRASLFDYDEALKEELPENILSIIGKEKSLKQEVNEALNILKGSAKSSFRKVIEILSHVQEKNEINSSVYAYEKSHFKSVENQIDIKIPEEYEETVRNISVKIDENKFIIDELDSGNIDIIIEKNGVPVEGIEINVKTRFEKELFLTTNEKGKIRLNKM